MAGALLGKATGDNEIKLAIPFKSATFAVVATGAKNSSTFGFMQHSTAPSNNGAKGRNTVRVANISSGGSVYNSDYNSVVCFGELENE